MHDFLKFLTDEDWAALGNAARHTTFDADAAIIEEGKRPRAIFVIQEGSARVVVGTDEHPLEVTRLRAGDIFGEMSFVEDYVASATVLTNEKCAVDVLEQHNVDRLLAESTGFSGRFYKSLAYVLSRRLRATTLRGVADFAWREGDTEALDTGPFRDMLGGSAAG